MEKHNKMIADLTNILLQNEKLLRIINDDFDIQIKQFNQLLPQLISYHQESSAALRNYLEDLPDVPAHSSYDRSNTFGLPIDEYSREDLETKSDSYKTSKIYESEVKLRKYLQDALENYELPEVYHKELTAAINQLTEILPKLERIDKVQG